MSGSIADVKQYPSGSVEIDAVRAEMQAAPTATDTVQRRLLVLHMWLGALQQQGADIRPFYDLNKECLAVQTKVVQSQAKGGRMCVEEEALSEAAEPSDVDPTKNMWDRLCAIVDQSLPVLEKIQTELSENGPWFEAKQDNESPAARSEGLDIEWPTFQGNIHNTGFTEGPGPVRGTCAWKFPVGLGWYAQPLIDGDRVYCTSPGMNITCFCFDLKNGSDVWRSHQNHPMFGIYKYPGLASTPVVQDDAIVIREMNSHGGDRGQAKHLVYIDKETGAVKQRKYAGHVDYRARYAPVTGNNEVMVYPFGVQDIYASPPVHQNFNRLVCKDKDNEQLFWDFNVGDIDILAQAVLTDTVALQGTEDGYLYAICLPQHPKFKHNQRAVIDWKFHADASINTSVCVDGDQVIFGANNGIVYCLDLATGAERWQIAVGNHEPRARKHFTVPLVNDGKVYIGSADCHLYCLNAADGAQQWSLQTGDWLRSRPAMTQDRVFVAGHDGVVTAVSLDGQQLWSKRISTHPIYADLTIGSDQLLIGDSDLHLFCLDFEGQELWQRDVMEAFTNDAGERIFTDTLSGGTFYQSKPVGYQGKLIFGTPSGFLLAVDPDSGEEIWKFEMGAAISVGAACENGRIFAGQQGGEAHFYCVDAETGAPIWKQAVPGGWVWGSAKVHAGKVYIPTVSGYAVCLDAETGHMIWMYQTAKSIPAEPAIDGDNVYFGSWSGSLYAFNKDSGKLVWKVNGVNLDSGTLISVDGKIYVPDHSNIFMCFDAQTGEVLSEGNKNKAEKLNYSNFNATPAFRGDHAYFSARVGVGLVGVPLSSRLYCVNRHDASVKWTFPDGGGLSAPAMADGKVYIASGNCPFLHCLDEETGESKWVYKMGNRVEESTLCVYRGKVYALAADGYVHAVQ